MQTALASAQTVYTHRRTHHRPPNIQDEDLQCPSNEKYVTYCRIPVHTVLHWSKLQLKECLTWEIEILLVNTIIIPCTTVQLYILITTSCLYDDLCGGVSNPGTLMAALQEYCPPSGDCRWCSVSDRFVTRPKVCAGPIVIFSASVRFPSGPVQVTLGTAINPLTAFTVHDITNPLPTIALSSGEVLIWTVAQDWGTALEYTRYNHTFFDAGLQFHSKHL